MAGKLENAEKLFYGKQYFVKKTKQVRSLSDLSMLKMEKFVLHSTY